MRVWTSTAPHPVYGISHARITDILTKENWLQKAVLRQGPTSIYYTYILYAGATPEEGPWMVEVNGNDVNWEYFPRTDDFSREFADLDDALRYANGEDDSNFAESTVPAERLYWPQERPPESHSVIEFNPRRPKRANSDPKPKRGGDDRIPPRGPDNEELVSKKKPHEMNEEEQRELLEHLTEVFSGMPCDFTEVRLTEDQRREYEKQVAREAQSDAEFMEEILQKYDNLPESEWPDGLFYDQGVSIRTLMQKRRVATAEQRRDCLAFYWSVFRKCPSCGTANNPDVRWCSYCGSDQGAHAAPDENEDRSE